MKHLRLDMYKANTHPQKLMKELRIDYQIAIPQSVYDEWWFFNCTNVPSTLPKYLTDLDIDLHDCIGRGLNNEDVENLQHK